MAAMLRRNQAMAKTRQLDTPKRRCLCPGGDGCVAQRESTVFTRRGSQVQTLSHPPSLPSDRFLQLLGDAERDLLARLDLDRLAGGGVAPHAGRALAHL